MMTATQIVDGYIAVLIPFMVAVCPKGSGWMLTIYDGTRATPAKPESEITLHEKASAEEAKRWASKYLAAQMRQDDKMAWRLNPDDPEPLLPWESLVCNPPIEQEKPRT